VIRNDGLLSRLSCGSLIAPQMTEGDVPKVEIQFDRIGLSEPRLLVLDIRRSFHAPQL
jgi:hypothetical protein